MLELDICAHQENNALDSKGDCSMPVFAVVSMNVLDEEKYAAYSALAGPTLEPHAVGRLGYDFDPRVIEGVNPSQRLVLLQFDDQAHFDRWYYSPEYQRAKAVRDEATETAFMMVIQGR
jgi:uncharacterized protein (DUF1330 family)